MTDHEIAEILAWECLDSRGRPTVGCRVTLADGREGRVVVPSGASTGRHEAVERRDGGRRYGGSGVASAVAAIRTTLAPLVVGRNADDQAGLDAALRDADGTPGLSRLGANAVLAVSLAVWVAATPRRPVGPVRLPMPMFNIVSGGAHADRAIDIQDILAIPIEATSAADAIEWGSRARHAASDLAAKAGLPIGGVADEGGLGVPFASNRAAIELVASAIDRAGLAEKVAIGLDVAATQLVDGGTYRLDGDDRTLDRDSWTTELHLWLKRYPIVSIEDPFGEDDWVSWSSFTPTAGIQVIGDDLFATNVKRLERGVREQAATAVLVKPNQIGTVTDARATAEAAHNAGMAVVTSARSGDTEDHWLVDLALSWGSDQLKVGSLTRSERTAKWNRMLELDADPAVDTTFAGWTGHRN